METENRAANEAYIQCHYPNEKFLSDTAELQSAGRHSKGLVMPENAKVAASRIPINLFQREVLRKELRQAEILSKLGKAVYLIPEERGYKIKPKDAVVNGKLFEFRTFEGNAETFQWEFRQAKKKGADTNVYASILSDISKEEARHRVWLVLRRHPEYTGEIIISFDDGRTTYFWDTSFFR